MKISQYNQTTNLAPNDKFIIGNAGNTDNNYIVYNDLYSQIYTNSRKSLAEIRNDGSFGSINTLLTGWNRGVTIGSGVLAIPNSGVIFVNKSGEYLVSVYGRGAAGGERYFHVTTGLISTNAGQLTGLGIIGANFPPRTATDSSVVYITSPTYFGVQMNDNSASYVRLRIEEL